jgi:hypothetical protein
MEANQRKFEISDAGSDFERKKANVRGWFDNEIRPKAEETKEGFQKMTTSLGIKSKGENDENRNENEFRKVGEGDDDFNLDCSNGCGLFST